MKMIEINEKNNLKSFIDLFNGKTLEDEFENIEKIGWI